MTFSEPASSADLGARSNDFGEITQRSEVGKGFEVKSFCLELVVPDGESYDAKRPDYSRKGM